VKPNPLDRTAGFAALAFSCESLFFGACAANLAPAHGDLGRLLIGLACLGFLVAWSRGQPRVQVLVALLLFPTALLVGSLLPPSLL
jgi:uncharacterized membrane protein